MKRNVRYVDHVWIACAVFACALATVVPACTMDQGGHGGGDDGPDCGDNVCIGGETPKSCPEDCGMPEPEGPVCGNSKCETGETTQNCSADCKPVCGNNMCETGETAQSCAADCATCGNNTCEGNEATTCPNDCPATLRVQNNSSYSIYGLYLAPCGGNWTQDLTGSSYIPPGYVFTVTEIPPGCWWFRATNSSEVYWQTPTSVTLPAASTYTWTLYN